MINEFIPIVSIVIPHFNREKIIVSAIESIMKQKFENWECLIVDDGSDANSKEIVKEILSQYPSDKFHFYERSSDREKGANACRNLGAEYSKGKYVAFLDSDDHWTENYLAEAVRFADKKEGFIASYSGTTILRDNKIKIVQSRELAPGEKLFDFLLAPDVMAQTSSYFLKKEVALEIKFDETLKKHQDYDFFIRLGQKYNWSYNPTCEIFMDWSTVDSRATDYDSCITVYERHKNEFRSKGRIQQGYLISCMAHALKKDAEPRIIRYYQKELKTVGYIKRPGLIFLINFPYIFKSYKRVINSIKGI